MLHVYLAGGFRATYGGERWQVWAHTKKLASNQIRVFDPSAHQSITDVAYYSTLDFAALKQCDVVLAYMDKENPGGYALATEIGYAHALGKLILLVDEKSETDPKFARYFAMTRYPCLVFPNLEEATSYLRTYAQTYQLY